MPDHWQETTLGEIADLEIGKTPPRNASQYWTESLGRPFCSIADMHGRVIKPSREGVTELAEDENKARRISAGSLLMSFKLTIGRMAFAGCDLFPNEAIVAITPNEVSASREFLYLNLGSRDLTEGSGQAVKGKTLNSKSLRAIKIHLPPLEQQRRIVDLVGSIDTYIDSLETQIETTRTARSVLLSELLSNPGDDWQETTLGNIARIEATMVDPTKPEFADLPHIGIEAIKSREGRLGSFNSVRGDGVTSGKFLFSEHDIIYSKIRPELRKVAYPQFVGLCSADAYPLRPASNCSASFLLVLLLSETFVEQAIAKSGRTKMPKINRRELFEITFSLPPADEQQRIVDLVRSLDEQISSLESQVDSVRALRSGVLSELLSGERLLDDSYDVEVGI